MANATAKVPMTTTPWGADRIYRPRGATATTYYSGCMLALDASGNVAHCDDTAGLKFDGINDEPVRTIISTGDTAGALPDMPVHRPFRFTMRIAAAVQGDEGRKVYAKFDNEVAYTSVNSILVGFVDQVLSATLVLITPIYAPLTPVAVSGNILAFSGATGIDQITIPDNLADALSVANGTGLYLTFVTTDGSEMSKLLGPAASSVAATGGSVQVTGGIGGATSGAGGTVVMAGGAGTAGNSAGGLVSLTGGAGQGTAAGGATSLVGGASGAGATGTGGAVNVTGGAATSTNGAGGAASLVGGLGTGNLAGGAITITSGAAGSTGVAGAVNISVGGATAGAGSAVTVTGGAGAGGTAAGGNVNLVGGAAVSTGVPGEVQVNAKSDLIPIQVALSATDASRAVAIFTRPVRLKSISFMHTTGSTSGTLQIEKLTGTTAAGSGTVLLTGTIDLSATTVANTSTAGTLIATVASLTFAAGDRVSVKIAGTMTNLAGGIVTIWVAPC